MEVHEGFVSAETVVEAAKSKKSALHDAFEWDDTTAAHEFRLTQARKVLRSIRIVIEVEEAEEEELTLGRFIIDAGPKEMPYVRADVVAGDEVLHQEALERAVRLLKGVRDRHRELKELADIWEAIDAL